MENKNFNVISKPITTSKDINNLSMNEYLLNAYIHNKLFYARQIQTVPNKLSQGVYLVCFRILNNNEGKKDLIYNYVYYHPDLYLSNIVYLILRSYYVYSLGYKEFGYYSVFLDKDFYSLGGVNEYINIDSTNGINSTWICEDVIKDTMERNLSKSKDINLALELITKLIHVQDIKTMSTVIGLGYQKSITKFIYLLLGTDYSKKLLNKDFSILNSSLFVVRDLNKLIDNVKERGFSVNKGPQKWRGQINSMTSFLSTIDADYRDSLYNHYSHHKNNLHSEYRHNLERKHFSFLNIHNNIGNVRYYSTSRKLSNRQQLFDNAYRSVTDIINTNKNSDKETIQISIERFLRNQEEVYHNESISKNILRFSEANYDLVQEKIYELNKLMSNWKNISSNSKINSELYKPWIKNISQELNSKKISELLIELFMYMVTKETINIEGFQTPGIPTIEVYNQFGRKLIDKYIYSLYTKREDKDLSLSQFKSINWDKFQDIYEDNFYARVGGCFVWNLSTIGLIYEDIDSKSNNSKEEMLYLRINGNIRKMFIKSNYKVFHLPLNLPMVCKPKIFEYSTDFKVNKLGGYLLNDVEYTDYIFKENTGYGKKTTLKENNSIVDLINGLSKTPYKINQETLDFIYQYGIQKKILLDPDSSEYKKFIEDPYKGFSKRDSKKYRSIFSKIVLERNILSIAETFSNVDQIYFPVRLDFRTRIYCETDYFDYQKSDLAKGLISFSNPGYLYKHNTDAIKYFKAYGANMFGDGLDKKSLNYRVKWIDDNSNRILNFENNDVVESAENKVCFISFCFEYKRFIEFIHNTNSVKFATYLPIQLDASCNGYQHLALLTREAKLFNKLNLDKSTFDDKPDDFYAYILDKTEEYIKKKIDVMSKYNKLSDKEQKVYDSYIILSKIKLDRGIVKKAIMTKSYNASIIKQVDLIAENLQEHFEGNNKYYMYKNDIKFKRFDIVTFVMCIREVIAIESPRINELSKYLDSVVSICTKLSVPIPWRLPSGADINQSYFVEKEVKIKAFSFVKSRYTFRKYLKDKYDLAKQKRATMPNLIHSLDATSIALLYEDFKNVHNLYTVHDCFAVTSDNVPKLMEVLKLVYMRLYSDNGYLSEFDQLVRLTINSTFGDKVFKVDGNFLYLPNGNKYREIPYPDINKVLNLNLNNKVDNLKESSYLLI
jgi:DNA-directed RNA polymerase